MIELCGKAIVEPLRHLFLLFLEEGVYPDYWKKRNVVPVHKKESKSLIKKYKLTSFLPVFSKCIKESFLTPYSITSLKISYLLNCNQVFTR